MQSKALRIAVVSSLALSIAVMIFPTVVLYAKASIFVRRVFVVRCGSLLVRPTSPTAPTSRASNGVAAWAAAGTGIPARAISRAPAMTVHRAFFERSNAVAGRSLSGLARAERSPRQRRRQLGP